MLAKTQKQPKRAGNIRTSYLTFLSWGITFYYSIKAMVTATFKRDPREHIDRVIRQWASALCDVIGLTINVHGRVNVESGKPCIIMCNHTSTYDIPVSFLAIDGSLRMLAKKELFKIPVFGRAMKMSEFVFIDRNDRQQAKIDLEHAKEKMESGIQIWIAPEGTRSNDGQLLPFKKGGFHLALNTGATIVPMVIKGINQVLPNKSFRFNLNKSVDVLIGEPIDASEFSLKSRAALTAQVYDSMQALLNKPLEQKHE